MRDYETKPLYLLLNYLYCKWKYQPVINKAPAMKDENKLDTPITIKESDIKGEEIIFDLVIKEKLVHVIVTKAGHQYHINLDGEDLGSFIRENEKIERYGQPRGAADDFEDYFKPIEAKLQALGK